MSPLRAVPAIARKLREWAFAFLSLCKRRWRWGAALLIGAAALELAARGYVLRRISQEAAIRGADVRVDGCVVTPFGISLRGVAASAPMGRANFMSVRIEWFPSRRLVVRDGHAQILRRESAQPSDSHARGRWSDWVVRVERTDFRFEAGEKSAGCSRASATLEKGNVAFSCEEATALLSGSRVVANEVDGFFRAGYLGATARRAALTAPPSSNEKREQPTVHEPSFDFRSALATAHSLRERARVSLRAMAENGRVRIDEASVGDLAMGSAGLEWGTLEGPPGPPASLNVAFGATFVEAQMSDFAVGRVLPKNPMWCSSESARLSGNVRVVDDDVVTGALVTKGFCVDQSRLSEAPLQLRPMSVDFRIAPGAADTWRVFAALAQGEAKLSTEFVLALRAGHPALQLELQVPEVRCQSVFDAFPVGTWSRVAGAEFAGTFSLQAKLNFELGAKEDPKLDYTISDQCRVVRVPQDIARDVFRRPFPHRFYAPDGTESVRLAGPGTSEWTPYPRLGKYLPLAVTAMEDATFFRHRGFHHPSLKSALIADLRAGAFVRGGSTVTMQLAKNLFLTRKKTLFRKLEEIVLTDYLEQTFSKEELLELYLNLIEFGPNVYGAKAASLYYFGATPNDLSLGEAFFLISVLPAPVKHAGMRANGTVPQGWVRYLRKAADNLRRAGALEQEDIEEAFQEPIGFLGQRKRSTESLTEEPPP